MNTRLCCAALTLLFNAHAAAAQVARQTDADHYTRYELLAAGSAKFRIVYEVTATTPGATRYHNPIRKGSIATDERVLDRATGRPLTFSVVSGKVARQYGVTNADTSGEYIGIELSGPVPADGEQRLLIDKTYEDAASYLVRGDTIIFTRSLGIRKNGVVLPAGYELLSVNYPSQVLTEGDGRVAVSYMNIGNAAVPYVVRAVKLARPLVGSARPGAPPRSQDTANSPSSREPSVATGTISAQLAVGSAPSRRADILTDPRLNDRAHQDREIVYFLQQPETHSFDLYHDYTESRPGVDKYLNVVRAGSRVANPSAYVLDTGERLNIETLKGAQITNANVDIGGPVSNESEVVVIRFTAPKAGESVRLRISETYTDPDRYRLQGDMLVWDREFGRPANAVVLPAGWALTNSAIPATVSRTPDGRVRLDFENPRPDQIGVLITGMRR